MILRLIYALGWLVFLVHIQMIEFVVLIIGEGFHRAWNRSCLGVGSGYIIRKGLKKTGGLFQFFPF